MGEGDRAVTPEPGAWPVRVAQVATWVGVEVKADRPVGVGDGRPKSGWTDSPASGTQAVEDVAMT